MRLKYFLVILILSGLFMLSLLIFNSSSKKIENSQSVNSGSKQEVEGQDVGNYFDKVKSEVKTTVTPLQNNKPKCNIDGNLVDEGTVVDGVTCVVN